MEIARTVDQRAVARWNSVATQILEHKALFAGCGAVVASWRVRGNRRFGPYFRVAYRDRGRQCSIYIGACGWVAEQVRRLLAKLQERFRWRRLFKGLKANARRALRRQKAQVNRLLALAGYWFKGWELRRLPPRAPRDPRPAGRYPAGSSTIGPRANTMGLLSRSAAPP